MRASQRKEGGFTLIELLVVMIIIGILSAVAVPIFMNQQKTARDTSLRSDMKNAATVVTTAMVDYQSFAKMRAAVGNTSEHYYLDNNSNVRTLWAGAPMWNEISGLPKISVGDGVYMEILNIRTANTASGWLRAHDDTEFCLVGIDLKSSYNWKSADGAAGYDKRLFYDSRMGGLVSMKQLVKAVQAGDDTSCSGHARAFINAGGTA